MSENIISLITQLNRYTLSGSLNWNREEPPMNIKAGTDSYIPLFFSTMFQNSKIGVYEERYRNCTDSEKQYWDNKIILCLVDIENNISTWEYLENPSILYNLFDSIKYKTSGISDILNKFK
ncbi:hypothetical protein [Pectobacterium brasiliense]|uniref:hypothetical protein n=1 Tax=Pectobacterium brasiliense TaxID=180957 RepID=UPI0019D3345A|nr:hypothetical protein [Pectobacterium brasiliense]MBN7768237.1 hypothetical protein [Pectobacterium brasiliense]